MNKKWCLLILALLLLSGCAKQVKQTAPELLTPVGVSMDTAIAVKRDLCKQQRYTGSISCESEEVWFTTDGELKSMLVTYGDEVKKGDVVALLEDKELNEQIEDLEQQIAYQKQVDEYTNTQLDLQRELSQNTLNELYANGVDWSGRRLAALDVEEKELAMKQAEEQQALYIAELEEKLEDLKSQKETKVLKAPVSGHVVYVNDQLIEGEWVTAYTPVYCITDESQLYAVTTLVPDGIMRAAEKMYAKLGNEEYEVEHVPYSQEKLLAMVLASDTALTSRFKLPADADIHPGDFAAIFVEYLGKENVLTIPANAVYTDDAGSFVYLVQEGKRLRQSVETGLVTDTFVEIESGLEEGDEVYVKE